MPCYMRLYDRHSPDRARSFIVEHLQPFLDRLYYVFFVPFGSSAVANLCLMSMLWQIQRNHQNCKIISNVTSAMSSCSWRKMCCFFRSIVNELFAFGKFRRLIHFFFLFRVPVTMAFVLSLALNQLMRSRVLFIWIEEMNCSPPFYVLHRQKCDHKVRALSWEMC